MIKKINVLGTEYKIRQRKKVFHNRKPAYGVCDFDKKIITIEKGLNSFKRETTFFHEFFHALLGESKIDLQLTDELNESVVDLLAENTVKLLRNELSKEDK